MGNDAKGGWRFQVTEADITKAEKSNSMRCVVAQTVARTLPLASRIDVDIQTIRWSENGVRHCYLTPYSVQGYIIAFDAGEPIEPFNFYLDTRKRVEVRQHRKTEAGKVIGSSQAKVRKARKAVKRLEEQGQLPLQSPAVQQVAKEQLAEARKEAKVAEKALGDARAAYAGAIQSERIPGTPTRPAPRRVHKTTTRTYGHRILRVNQPE